MKTSDLIALLQAEDPNAPVIFLWEEDGKEAFSSVTSVISRIGHRLPGDKGTLMASAASTPGLVVQLSGG